jgi:hypothetical protein
MKNIMAIPENRQYAGMSNQGSYFMIAERHGVPLTVYYDGGYLRYHGDRQALRNMLERPQTYNEASQYIQWELWVNRDDESHVKTIAKAEEVIEYDLDLEAFSLYETDQWLMREPGDRPPRPLAAYHG